MNDIPSASVEMVKATPLLGAAAYLQFMSVYGAALVTTLALAYGIMQIVMRWMEHRAIMRKHTEVPNACE